VVSADVFNYVVTLAFVVLAGFLSWASYRLVKTLERLDLILADIKGALDEIEGFKSGLKMGIVSLISALVGRIKTPAKKMREVRQRE